MKGYPTYREFCKFLYCIQKRTADNKRKLIPTWQKISCYGLGLIAVTILWIIGGLFFLFLASMSSGYGRNKYPSSQYRKVVKEGLLWDSVEYHEK